MYTFILTTRGPFSLEASTRFLEGFTPAAFTGVAGQPLELAFPVEGTWQAAGVRVCQHECGVACEVMSPPAPGPDLLAAVRAQVARILSLDVDGSGFPAVGERDPVVAGLQRRYPGLRPVGFWSPYEAAAWAIIGRKPGWLRSVALAALEGRLDAARLRALPRDQALAQLRQLPGIGDFSAELVLLRGAGDPDHIPRHEPRLARAVALAYGLPEPPSGEQLLHISENWRPYRTWVTLLLRTQLEDQTGEIADTPHTPGHRQQ